MTKQKFKAQSPLSIVHTILGRTVFFQKDLCDFNEYNRYLISRGGSLLSGSLGDLWDRYKKGKDEAPEESSGNSFLQYENAPEEDIPVENLEKQETGGENRLPPVPSSYKPGGQMMKPHLVGAADVHAGPAAHRLQAFQDLDVLGRISAPRGRMDSGLFQAGMLK